MAINAFPDDHDSEHRAIREIAESMGARVAVCRHFAEGGKGATDLAEVWPKRWKSRRTSPCRTRARRR